MTHFVDGILSLALVVESPPVERSPRWGGSYVTMQERTVWRSDVGSSGSSRLTRLRRYPMGVLSIAWVARSLGIGEASVGSWVRRGRVV